MFLRVAVEIIGFYGWLRHEVLPPIVYLSVLIGVPALAAVAIVQTVCK